MTDNFDETNGPAQSGADPFFEPLAQKAAAIYGVAAGRRGRARLLAALGGRLKSLGLDSLSAYAAVIRQDENEWSKVWPAALGGEEFFFKPAAQFDLARDLVQEWAVSAPDRSLKILSLGCGGGHELYSLAMVLEEAGLRGKGWQLELHGLDLNPEAIEKARRAVYEEVELTWLSPAQRKKWFTPRAGAFYFKSSLAAPVSFHQGNAFDMESWPFQEFVGAFDVIFCRGLTWDAPPLAPKKLALLLRRALAPTGFIFTAPGEFLPDDSGELDLEERRGLTWYRRGPRRIKLNRRHVSKKERAGKAGPVHAEAAPEFDELSPREKQLLASAKAALAGGDLDSARDFANELAYGAERPLPELWLFIAELEQRSGRPDSARAAEVAALNYWGGGFVEL